jgi:hypothetical protein
MTSRRLKYWLGGFLILAHFGLVVFSIVLYFLHGFSIEEFTTVIAILVPVFAGHTTSILAFIIKDAQTLEDISPRVNAVYSSFSFLIPLLLVAIVALTIGLKAYNRVFSNFEEFKRFFLLIESLFSAYVGMFVYSLFEKREAVGLPRTGTDPA